MIHFDTSFVVDFLRETLRDDPGPATALLDSLPPENLAVSVFAVCELLAGAARPAPAAQAPGDGAAAGATAATTRRRRAGDGAAGEATHPQHKLRPVPKYSFRL